MKSVLVIALVFVATSVQAQVVIKRQCLDTNTRHPVCKNIHIHKKVPGTTVPDAPIRHTR